MQDWIIQLRGPSSTPYADGIYTLSFTFSSSYPMKPPNVMFTTPIYHPQVSMTAHGAICQDVIAKEWSPTLRVNDIIDRIIEMMKKPTGENALEAEIGELFATNRSKFDDTAKAWNKKHARV
jgi:ubiquitin-protein ligase